MIYLYGSKFVNLEAMANMFQQLSIMPRVSELTITKFILCNLNSSQNFAEVIGCSKENLLFLFGEFLVFDFSLIIV